MRTCDTCKYWGQEEWARMAHIEPMRICQRISDMSIDEILAENEAGIYKSIDSSLATGPKFGCIHHEPK